MEVTADLRQKTEVNRDAIRVTTMSYRRALRSVQEVWKIIRAMNQDPSPLTNTQQDRPHVVGSKTTRINARRPR